MDHPVTAAPAAEMKRRLGTVRPVGQPGPNRQASIARRRSRWPGFAVFLLAMGGLAVGLGIAAASVPTTDQPSVVLTALTAVLQWAPAIAKSLIGAGLVVLALGVSWRLLRRRRRELRARVLAAASAATRVGLEGLTLRRARWARRGRGLRSGVLKYRPAEAVVEDCSESLTAVLAPHIAAPVMVRWVPRRSRFEITARPVIAPKIEERSAQLG